MGSSIYNDKIKHIYGGDPRELPLYGLTETAKYLKINLFTLKSWVNGRSYKLADGTAKWWKPVIDLPDPKQPLLSFYNLVEVHVLSGIRRIHNIQFYKVRLALNYIETQFEDTKHPLATRDFWADKFDLFIRESGSLICASQQGQTVIEAVVKQYLHRIERDNFDLTAFRLYPFSKSINFGFEDSQNRLSGLEAMPKNIVIDPLVSFGRPTLADTGVPTNVIAGRFKGGENIESISDDYEIEKTKITEALTYEGVLRRAA